MKQPDTPRARATHYKLIIIGSGPAGLTAALYAARARIPTLVLEGDTPGGQLMGTTYVDNWPGTPHILGAQLMMQMRDQAEQQGAVLLAHTVRSIDTAHRPFAVHTQEITYTADALIIASGATPKKLGCPGEQEYWGKGVSSCAVCDGAFYTDQPVVIVGGGDTAMENASFMTKFTQSVTVVHIKPTLTASASMQERVIDNPAIRVIYSSTVVAITGSATGTADHVTGVTVRHMDTGQEQTIPARAVFVSIGLTPGTGFVSGQLPTTATGHLELSSHTQTGIPGIFAAGDVVDCRYRQAIVSAGTGCMAALDAQRYLES